MSFGFGFGFPKNYVAALFTPAQLFANGEQGAWYDPSDLTTLFQDSAGTTPVTAVEQPVGLMLDKSKGLMLGPELVTNGDFSGGTTGWSAVGLSASVVSGEAQLTRSNVGQRFYQSVIVESGKTYRVSLSSRSGTTQVGVFGGSTEGGTNLFPATLVSSGSTTTYSFVVRPTSSAFFLSFYLFTDGTGFIDNISVRELPGNHAFQTTSANRPVLSARVNLLTKTEEFGDAIWTENVAGSKASTTELDPNGNPTAVKINNAAGAGAGIRQVTSFNWSGQTSLDVWLKSDGVNNSCAVILFSAGSAVATQTVSGLTTSWQKYTITGSATSGGLSIAFQRTLGSGFFFAAFPDLRVSNGGVGIPSYQRVNTPADYDTVGFPLYLKANGTNTAMQTNSVDFTGTDKMTVVAGVRKLSDAAIASTIFETSSSISSNNRTFGIFGPDGLNTGSYDFISRGTLLVPAIVSSGYSAPITNVLTGIGDISGDSAILRVNGTQAASSTADQGTGNYGNYPLYLFARAGTSLFFNGNFYGAIIRGAQSTAAQISSAEQWMNQKTKAY